MLKMEAGKPTSFPSQTGEDSGTSGLKSGLKGCQFGQMSIFFHFFLALLWHYWLTRNVPSILLTKSYLKTPKNPDL